MGSLADFSEKKTLDHILKVAAYAPSSTVYLGLSSADPLDTGVGMVEPTDGGYTRVPILFGSATTKSIAQSVAAEFPLATTDWGTQTHVGLFSALDGGDMLGHSQLTTPREVLIGNRPNIAIGEVVISLASGGTCIAIGNKILNWLFGGATFTQPANLYAALCKTTGIVDADTGLTITELMMTGYSRQLANTWNPALGESPALSDNTSDIDFGALTGIGETCVAMCIIDSSSSDGNIYAYTNDPSLAIASGDPVKILAGTFDVTLV